MLGRPSSTTELAPLAHLSSQFQPTPGDAPMTLLHWADDRFHLGVLVLDQTHWEMVQLLNNLDRMPPERFADLYLELVRHTGEHFAGEERLMEESAYPLTADHRADHRWVMEKLEEMQSEVAAGRTAAARVWLREHLVAWFQTHLVDHDRPLAEHIKVRTPARAGFPRRVPSPPR